MKISVVIPVFNQVELTERCLDSVFQNSVSVTEVVVVDNASTDSTRAFLVQAAARFQEKNIRLEVITNEKNAGFGRACNQAIRKVRGDFVAILNNDTWLMPAWDEVLANQLKKNAVDCIGPYFYEGPIPASGLESLAKEFTTRNQNKTRHHFLPILLFFKKESVDRLALDHGGIFDERFFVTYEDTDLQERMNRQGMRYLQTGACFIWHHSMGTRKALPCGYEQEGLSLFIQKWGFDPRPRDHTVFQKWKRKFWKLKENAAYFDSRRA